MARRSVRLIFQGALAATLFSGIAASARAAPVAEDWVTWRGASGAPACIDGAAFESDVSRRLGEDARLVARRVGLRLEVDLGDEPAGAAPAPTPEPLASTRAAMPLLVATFAGSDGRPIGRRRFDLRGSSCQSAFEALSIATTLVLQDRAHVPEPATARPAVRPVGEGSPEVLAGPRAMVAGAPPLPPETDGQVRSELLLIEHARALLELDPEHAIELGQAHAREFPDGVMGEERDAIVISALLALGRLSEARALQASFDRDHPASPYTAGLRDRERAVTRTRPRGH